MIPYAVDASFDRQPVVNWLIFGVLIPVFALQSKLTAEQIEPFVLDGWGIVGLFGHIWLHANIVHLIFELLFLWPFGNAVCAQIGNKAYPAFYLGLGLLGGIIHALFGGGPAFGASVAISGIVGMYIVFFPENTMNCLFLLPHPVTLSISSYFVVSVWFFVDLLLVLFRVQVVTYFAHIVGFGVGFGLAVLMLKKKWVVMERGERSLLQMLAREKKEEEEEKKEEEGKEPEAIEKGEERPEIEKAVPEKAVMEAEKPEDEFIRFSCECGKRIKVPREYAGETGRCPRCKRPVKVPER